MGRVVLLFFGSNMEQKLGCSAPNIDQVAGISYMKANVFPARFSKIFRHVFYFILLYFFCRHTPIKLLFSPPPPLSPPPPPSSREQYAATSLGGRIERKKKESRFDLRQGVSYKMASGRDFD